MADPDYPKYWDENEKRWYRMRYDPNTAQWVFHDWIPIQAPRRDSAYHQPGNYQTNASPGASGSHAGPARTRLGNRVQGSYNTLNPRTDETLDAAYFVRQESYFQEGRVFAILFTEAAGAQSTINAVTDYNTALSRVRYNEYAHTQVRRFIIVRHRRGFCYAVPIFTYSNQGTMKHGVVPDEHSIAFAWGTQPMLLPGEQQLTKSPICVILNDGERLVPASRIFFGIHHPIQYNVKVKDLGYVHPDYMHSLIGYFNQENGNETQQPTYVTDAADDDTYQ